MGRPKSETPTDAEMRILAVLWKHGKPICIRNIHDEIPSLAFTSLATIVRIMVTKGFVTMTDSRRPQKFAALISRSETMKRVAVRIVRDNFGGSPAWAIEAICNAHPVVAPTFAASA